MAILRVLLVTTLLLSAMGFADAEEPARGSSPHAPTVRTIDLNIGESLDLEFADGSSVKVKLVSVNETRDPLRDAIREACVTVEIDSKTVELVSATYHLPVQAGNVQIDCPVTRGYTLNARNGTITGGRLNAWGLQKDARLRLWPAGLPWMPPGSLGYPLRQRWFASDSHMSNEPTFVNGDERMGGQEIYYHYGLDFGGAEGLVEVIAATDGLVVSAAGETLPEHADSPARRRYDVIYILDERGWYYRYSHLKTIDVKPGQKVTQGQRLGLLGKEGGSGGWSHLHFDVTSRQPSGEWGIQDAYAYVWEAYQREYHPQVIAVARPHVLAATGQPVELNASKSWSSSGPLSRFDWRFTDGTTATGARLERTYDRPGTYSEMVRVTDVEGRESIDFAVVQVLDPKRPDDVPPTIHAAYSPTLGIRPGDEVTFKVRTFRTTEGTEQWDFGDGSPPVDVQSDGAVKLLAPNGYAVTTHRYDRAGAYVARVQRSNRRGETATAHVVVTVQDLAQEQDGRFDRDAKAPHAVVGAPRRLTDWTGSLGASFAVAMDHERDRLHLVIGDRGMLFHTRSADGGATWTPRRELIRGDSHDIAVDKRGVVHLVYKSLDHEGRIEHRTITDEGLGPSTDVSASEGSRPAVFHAPKIAVDGGNNVHVIFWSIPKEGEKRDGWRLGYACKPDDIAGFTPTELWRDHSQAGFSKYGDLFVDRDGRVHIFYATVSSNSHGIERRIWNPSGEWGAHDRWESRLMADWSMATSVDKEGVVHISVQRIVDKVSRVLYLNNRADRNVLAIGLDAGADSTETYTDLLVEDSGDIWLTTGHREGPGRGSSSPLNIGTLYHADRVSGKWGTGIPLSETGAVNVTARQSGHPRLIQRGSETRVIYLKSEEGQQWTLWQRVLGRP